MLLATAPGSIVCITTRSELLKEYYGLIVEVHPIPGSCLAVANTLIS